MRNDDAAGATTLRKPPTRQELSRLVDQLDAIATIPLVAERVGQLVHDPRSDARSIAEAMRGDPALSAKVLKLVNSPYFGIPGGVSDVTRAISFLGFNTIHQLVLTVSVFKVLGNPADDAARLLFRHSLAAAGAAESIAEIVGHGTPAECFTAGLLHDLGKLALLQIAPDVLRDAEQLAAREGISQHDAEGALGILHHDAIGQRLARKWRFPLPLPRACAAPAHVSPRR